MTSNDNQQYITVELFNSKMDTLLTQIRFENEKLRSELKTEIQAVRSELHNEIQTGLSSLNTQIQVNSAQIAELHHFMYWGFALLTIVTAIIPLFRRERKEQTKEHTQSTLTEDRVKDLIAQALANRKAAV